MKKFIGWTLFLFLYIGMAYLIPLYCVPGNDWFQVGSTILGVSTGLIALISFILWLLIS